MSEDVANPYLQVEESRRTRARQHVIVEWLWYRKQEYYFHSPQEPLGEGSLSAKDHQHEIGAIVYMEWPRNSNLLHPARVIFAGFEEEATKIFEGLRDNVLTLETLPRPLGPAYFHAFVKRRRAEMKREQQKDEIKGAIKRKKEISDEEILGAVRMSKHGRSLIPRAIFADDEKKRRYDKLNKKKKEEEQIAADQRKKEDELKRAAVNLAEEEIMAIRDEDDEDQIYPEPKINDQPEESTAIQGQRKKEDELEIAAGDLDEEETRAGEMLEEQIPPESIEIINDEPEQSTAIKDQRKEEDELERADGNLADEEVMAQRDEEEEDQIEEHILPEPTPVETINYQQTQLAIEEESTANEDRRKEIDELKRTFLNLVEEGIKMKAERDEEDEEIRRRREKEDEDLRKRKAVIVGPLLVSTWQDKMRIGKPSLSIPAPSHNAGASQAQAVVSPKLPAIPVEELAASIMRGDGFSELTAFATSSGMSLSSLSNSLEERNRAQPSPPSSSSTPFDLTALITDDDMDD